MTKVSSNLLDSFKSLNFESTNEQIEKLRTEKISSLLSKVSSKIELSELEKLELQSEVKISDLKDRVLLVRKNTISFKVTYSDNSFNFITKNNEISTKRIPLQILALKYGTCLNYLLSLNFKLDLESNKSEYSKVFNNLVLESSKGAKIETINQNKQVAKFDVRLNGAILKVLDSKIALKSNVSYGSVSTFYLESIKAKEAKELAKLVANKAKGIIAKKESKKTESFVLA